MSNTSSETFTISDEDKIELCITIDPNHIRGSTIKLVNGESYHTKYNLSSTLLIEVDNFDELLTQIKNKDYLEPIEKSYKTKYKDKLQKALKTKDIPIVEKWNNLALQHEYHGKITELAWKESNQIKFDSDEAKSIVHTATLSLGICDLYEATKIRGNRNPRFWGYDYNYENIKNIEDRKTIIESCGVCFIDKSKNILTFPNFKLCSDYSLPGGSIDWNLKDVSTKNIHEQCEYAITNAIRELKEEIGINIEFNFNISNITKNILLNKNIVFKINNDTPFQDTEEELELIANEMKEELDSYKDMYPEMPDLIPDEPDEMIKPLECKL
tara:strand:- start:402 stop:1382 length:981 start_codon:yes stop_codon:yes gene_type:complete